MDNTTFPASRREFISRLSASCAALLSPALLAGDLSAIQREKNGAIGKGKLLSTPQMKVLAALADIIIPRTETAGASEVDAHGVIDDQLANCQSPTEAKGFVAQLEQFSLIIKTQYSLDFDKLPEDEQHKHVLAAANNKAPFSALNSGWFLTLKSLVTLSYYTSEEGGSNELVYDPIPGGFNGHFKLSENQGRAFSIYHI